MKVITRNTVLWVFPLITLAYLAYVVILRESPSRMVDAQWFYVSGKSWIAGDSPYDLAAFHRHWIAQFGTVGPGVAFAFPPTTAILSVPAGLLSWKLAQLYFAVVNMTALCTLWWVSVALIGTEGRSSMWLPLAIGASGLISSVPGCIYIGQVGILATLGAFGLLWAAREGRPWTMALFALLASIKPQLALLVCLYALVRYGPKHFLPSLALTIGVSGAVVLRSSPSTFLSDYQLSVQRFWEFPFSQAEAYAHLGALSGRSFFLVFALCGAFLVLAIAMADRSRTIMSTTGQPTNTMPQSLMCVIAITLACMPLHKYDWVILVPAVIMLVRIRPVIVALGFAVVLVYLARINNWVALAGGFSSLQFIAISIFLLLAVGHWAYKPK